MWLGSSGCADFIRLGYTNEEYKECHDAPKMYSGSHLDYHRCCGDGDDSFARTDTGAAATDSNTFCIPHIHAYSDGDASPDPSANIAAPGCGTMLPIEIGDIITVRGGVHVRATPTISAPSSLC